MAREINIELLDSKIEKAQEDLVKAKHRYDAAAKTLKDLLDKRDAIRQKKLLAAIAQSGRSYEEIMQYLQAKSGEE
jgi:flagellar biosynthesis chaperone FliJ